MGQRWFLGVAVTCMLSTPVASEAANKPRTSLDRAEQLLVVQIYPVADLVVPLPGRQSTAGPGTSNKLEKEFGALEQHLRNTTGTDAWTEHCSIKRHESTLSIAVRQTSAVHERIAEELNRLRRELDVQVVLELHVISGSRQQLAALANSFPGELGQFETEQLLKLARETSGLQFAMSPKITVFSRQTAQLNFAGQTIVANATISDDRRSIRLKVSAFPENTSDLLDNVQMAKIHSGRTVALHFEAPRIGGNIPPAPDAEERLVIITPRLLVIEEAEESPKLTITVKPRIIIQEEEEELPGIPQ